MFKVEYRVRPVTRYIISRYEPNGPRAGSHNIAGEYDSEDTAYSVAYALAEVDRDKLGCEFEDGQVIHPVKPDRK